MQKRFTPDAGGVFPEWEEIEFGKLFQRRSEKNGEEFGVDKTISVATMHFKPEGNKAAEESLPKYRVLRKGDIAYEGNKSKHFKHGRFVLNDIGDGIISPIFEVLQPVSELSKEVPEFWKYYINYEPVMGKILAKCANTGIMMNRLAIKDFYKQKIKVPCIVEQRKIAAALAAYDEMIAVKTAKLETWQECKKRMVKEIFGRTKRFKDDDGREFPEWEEKTLGTIVSITTGKLNANEMVDGGQFDFYTSGVDVFKIDKAAFNGPAITVAGNGANVGCLHLADGKFNAYQRTYVLQDFLACREYIYAAIEVKLPNVIKKYKRGSAIPYIVMDMLADLKIPLPCMEEQQKIGSFLAEIDKEIKIEKEFVKTYAEGKKKMMRELMEVK